MSKKSYDRPLEHKEYLKLKYMSGSVGHEKQKKKKKQLMKNIFKNKKIRIFDDDIDLKNIDQNGSEEELYYGTKEEKPVIAAVVDERPLHMRRNDIDKNRWKTIGSNVEEMDTNSQTNANGFSNETNRESVNKRLRHDSDSDLSLIRPNVEKKDTKDKSLRSKRHDSDSDLSPPRNTKLSDTSRGRRRGSGSDLSPIRHNVRKEDTKDKSSRSKRHDSDSDLSPPRKSQIRDTSRGKRHDSGSDLSPPRETHHTLKGDDKHISSNDRNISSRNHKHDKDLSPPRHRSRNSENRCDSHRDDADSDLSPPRSQKGGNNLNKRHNEPKKSELTLAGKKSGLSDAKELRKELMSVKKKEQNLFDSISDEMLGKNAKTVFRDSKSGKVRDLEEEARLKYKEDSIKDKIDLEKKAKYEKWSKGLVQKAQQEERLESDLHEMSKPLARYGDDQDLDQMLRQREREDDPMLATIRKNRAKQGSKDVKLKPSYNGPTPPPNRFNIMPGYRWDGVDRSNGFEKKCFDKISNKESSLEEAYRWSTQDM